MITSFPIAFLLLLPCHRNLCLEHCFYSSVQLHLCPILGHSGQDPHLLLQTCAFGPHLSWRSRGLGSPRRWHLPGLRMKLGTSCACQQCRGLWKTACVPFAWPRIASLCPQISIANFRWLPFIMPPWRTAEIRKLAHLALDQAQHRFEFIRGFHVEDMRGYCGIWALLVGHLLLLILPGPP